MTTIPDGYDILRFREFHALLKRFESEGVSVADHTGRRLTRFELTLELEETSLRLGYARQPDLTFALNEWDVSVYHWPEFAALCRRLGIAWEFLTKRMTISICEGEHPRVIHEYAFADTNPSDDFQPAEIGSDSHSRAADFAVLISSCAVEVAAA